MKHLWQIYRAHFRIWAAVQMQYRVAALIWLIGLFIPPVVYLVVWATVANTMGGAVDGLTGSDFAAYFIALMVVNHLAFSWHMWEYDYIIRQGRLSPRLLRPFHPIHMDIAENLSYKLITMIVVAPTAVLLAVVFNASFEWQLWRVLAFVPAMIMAFLIQFLLGWMLAILAFWTARVSAINRTYFLGKLFLGGQIAPLMLLPPQWQLVASISPYRWMLSFPVELLMGWPTPVQAVQGLLVQVVWVALSIGLVQVVWRSGVRRYAAFGA